MFTLDSGGGGCFPSTAKVILKNGNSVLMSQLQIEDQVQTGIRLLIPFGDSSFRCALWTFKQQLK